MEFQLSGLVSGFDWLTMVDRITEINRIPQNRLVAEQSILSGQLSSLDDLKSKLEELEDAAEILNSASVFFGRSASVSDSDAGILTASVKAETQIGTYAFVISQLATQTMASPMTIMPTGLPTSQGPPESCRNFLKKKALASAPQVNLTA